MASHGVPRVSGVAAQEKSEQAREKERKQIREYLDLEKDVFERIRAKDFSNPTLQQTSRLLAQNPEYYTIWNHRRLILQDVFARELETNNTHNNNNNADPSTPPSDSPPTTTTTTRTLTPAQNEILLLTREDLTFLLPLLKQYPKCYWIWNHRSWLLRTATTHLPPSASTDLWTAELALVAKMLALDSRNFHGWGYRREVVAELERLEQPPHPNEPDNKTGERSPSSPSSSSSSRVETEFAYTTAMIHSNLSNFSAWHYRSTLIPRLLTHRDASPAARRTFLAAEFELITTALYTDPYDQSLWFYHAYLVATLDPGNAQAGEILSGDGGGEEEVRGLMGGVLEGVRELLDGAEDGKFVYQALLECAVVYRGLGGVVEEAELRGWLGELRALDGVREGRWRDWERRLGV